MLIGLFGGIEESGTAAGLLGGGAALILFATSLFSPRLVRPLASLAGKPMERVRGLTGRLARENAMRKPGRTATTAAALMIGLALVTFVTVFAAGLKSSIANTIDENFKSDVILQNTDGFSPIPRDAVAAAQRRRRRRERLRDHLRIGRVQGRADPRRRDRPGDDQRGPVARLRGGLARSPARAQRPRRRGRRGVGRLEGARGGRHRERPNAAREEGDLHDPRGDRGRSRPVRQDARQRRDARAAVRRRPAEPRLRAARARSVRRHRSRAIWRRRSPPGIPPSRCRTRSS